MTAHAIHYVAEGPRGKARVIENVDGTYCIQYEWSQDVWLYVTDDSDDDLGRIYFNALDRARRAARAFVRPLIKEVA